MAGYVHLRRKRSVTPRHPDHPWHRPGLDRQRRPLGYSLTVGAPPCLLLHADRRRRRCKTDRPPRAAAKKTLLRRRRPHPGIKTTVAEILYRRRSPRFPDSAACKKDRRHRRKGAILP